MISYDYAADDHAAEMADLRNDAEAADGCTWREAAQREHADRLAKGAGLTAAGSLPVAAGPASEAITIIANASRDASLRGDTDVAQDLLRAARWLQGRAA